MRVLALERISPQRPEIPCGKDLTRHTTVDKCEIGAESGFQECDPHGASSQSSLEKRNKRRGSYRGELRRQEPLGSCAKLTEGTKNLRHQEKDDLNAVVFKLQLKSNNNELNATMLKKDTISILIFPFFPPGSPESL